MELSASVSGDKKKSTTAGLALHRFVQATCPESTMFLLLFLLPPPHLLLAFHRGPLCTMAEGRVGDRSLMLKSIRACQNEAIWQQGKVPLLAVPWNL